MSKQLQRAEAWLKPDLTPTERFAELIEYMRQEIEEMTTNAKLAQIRPTVNTAVSVYTAPTSAQGGRGTVITQFSATDPAGAATFDVHIGTAASATTIVVDGATAALDGTTPAALINAMIAPGEQLFVTSSAADTVLFLVSGIVRRN